MANKQIKELDSTTIDTLVTNGTVDTSYLVIDEVNDSNSNTQKISVSDVLENGGTGKYIDVINGQGIGTLRLTTNNNTIGNLSISGSTADTNSFRGPMNIALGNANTAVTNTIVDGNSNSVTGDYNVIIGNSNTSAMTRYSVLVGNASSVNGIGNIAVASTAPAAITGSYNISNHGGPVYLNGSGNLIIGGSSSIIGNPSTFATGSNNIIVASSGSMPSTFGSNNLFIAAGSPYCDVNGIGNFIGGVQQLGNSGTGNLVLGQHNKIDNGIGSIVFGSNSTVLNGQGSLAGGNTSLAEGNYAIALGENTTVNGNASVAIGTDNRITDNFSGAFGCSNRITTSRSYGIGVFNIISKPASIAIGGATIEEDSDFVVAIGNCSTTSTSVGNIFELTDNGYARLHDAQGNYVEPLTDTDVVTKKYIDQYQHIMLYVVKNAQSTGVVCSSSPSEIDLVTSTDIEEMVRDSDTGLPTNKIVFLCSSMNSDFDYTDTTKPIQIAQLTRTKDTEDKVLFGNYTDTAQNWYVDAQGVISAS